MSTTPLYPHPIPFLPANSSIFLVIFHFFLPLSFLLCYILLAFSSSCCSVSPLLSIIYLCSHFTFPILLSSTPVTHLNRTTSTFLSHSTVIPSLAPLTPFLTHSFSLLPPFLSHTLICRLQKLHRLYTHQRAGNGSLQKSQ